MSHLSAACAFPPVDAARFPARPGRRLKAGRLVAIALAAFLGTFTGLSLATRRAPLQPIATIQRSPAAAQAHTAPPPFKTNSATAESEVERLKTRNRRLEALVTVLRHRHRPEPAPRKHPRTRPPLLLSR